MREKFDIFQGEMTGFEMFLKIGRFAVVDLCEKLPWFSKPGGTTHL
jgi:hypothetical protein